MLINKYFLILFLYNIYILLENMGIGDLGIGDWGLGPIPKTQYPKTKTPNPKPQNQNYFFN